MTNLKFNQCQDCGCPGGQLAIMRWGENLAQVQCPYCGRKGSVFPIKRGMTKGTPNTLAIASWNSYNRENEEGLG